jgi:hypothetical protein
MLAYLRQHTRGRPGGNDDGSVGPMFKLQLRQRGHFLPEQRGLGAALACSCLSRTPERPGTATSPSS